MENLREERHINIGEAAKMLSVSVDTLRRWDKSGKLRARVTLSGRRYYSTEQIALLQGDLYTLALSWASAALPREPIDEYYCPNSSVFQTRLMRMGQPLADRTDNPPWLHLLTAAVGEVGNNSFDHNIGNWPDILGVFFGYDLDRRMIIVADRGVGVLSTLRQVRPQLRDDTEALRVAFTEVVSGRAPEARGNGLKFVARKVIAPYPLALRFQSGDAEATIKNGEPLSVAPAITPIRGTLALFTY